MKNAIYVGLGVLLIAASFTSAAVLFEDGFESDTATMDFNDTSQTYYPAGWSTTADNSKDVMVYNVNAINDANKPATVPQGVNAMRLITFTAAPSTEVSWGTGNQQVSVGFELYINDLSSTARSLDIQLKDATSIGVFLSIYHNTAAGSDIKYHNGTAWQTLASGVTSNAWEEMLIVADSETNTFTLSYAGITYDNGGSGYAFFSNIGDIQTLRFSPQAQYAKHYIDEVSVQSIPEPATLGLLAAGSLAMLIRRKR